MWLQDLSFPIFKNPPMLTKLSLVNTDMSNFVNNIIKQFKNTAPTMEFSPT